MILMDLKERFKKRIPLYRKNPVLFSKEVLHKKPDRIQARIMMDIEKHDMVALKSGHGIGKTFIAANTVLWWISCFPNSRAITTAPTWRQVREVLWAEIHKNSRGTILRDIMEFQTSKIKLTEHWGAIGVSSDRPENIEGFHADYLLFEIDEAKGVSQSIFEGIMGTQTTKTKIFMLSTPTPNPLGEFFDAFKPGSIYHTIHVSCLDSPRPGMKKYIEMMKRKYGEDSPIYQMRVLGEFPEVTEDTLIPWKHVNASVKRNIVIDPKQEFKRIICCDVARFGQDLTVIMVIEVQRTMSGNVYKLVDCEYFGKKPTTYTTGRLIEMDKKWHGNEIRVDAGGGDLGAGVVDQLRTTDVAHKVVAYVAGGKEGFTEEDNAYYLNWKSKGYDHLRIIHEQGRIDIYDVGDLCEQLVLLRRSYSINGKLKILDYEEEIKSTDVKHKSPDFSDCLKIGCAPLRQESFHVLEDPEGLI